MNLTEEGFAARKPLCPLPPRADRSEWARMQSGQQVVCRALVLDQEVAAFPARLVLLKEVYTILTEAITAESQIIGITITIRTAPGITRNGIRLRELGEEKATSLRNRPPQ